MIAEIPERNVEIAVIGAIAFLVDAAGAKVRLEGLSSSGDVGVWARYGGVVFLTGKNAFGACGFRHIGADNGGSVEMLGGEIAIEGAAPHHLYADAGGHIFYALGTTTISGTPGFSFGFAYAQSAALITCHGMTWSGTALGPRYQAVLNGVINVNGSGPDYFPGDSAGVLGSGGHIASPSCRGSSLERGDIVLREPEPRQQWSSSRWREQSADVPGTGEERGTAEPLPERGAAAEGHVRGDRGPDDELTEPADGLAEKVDELEAIPLVAEEIVLHEVVYNV